MRMMVRMVMLSVFAIMAVALVSPPVAAYGQLCNTCHTGNNPSSGYVLQMPRVTIDFPMAAPPNASIGITLRVDHPGSYELAAPRATIATNGAGWLSPEEPATKPLPPISSSGGSAATQWNLTMANSSGTLFIGAKLNFTAYFRHTVTHDNDERQYSLMQYGEIAVRPLALYTSVGELQLRTDRSGGSTGFQLVTYSEIRNLSLTLSSNLKMAIEITPGFIGSLPPGRQQYIEVSSEHLEETVNNGRIDITWENATGMRNASFVSVRILGPSVSPPPAGNNPLRLTGRVMGMFSLGLLIGSLVLGMVKWGGKRRVRIHCAISWFIVGLSAYHGIMLVLGPYSRQIWGNFLLLGYASAVLMGVSGVNGLIQGWMSRVAGYKTWQWTHRIAIIAAVVLVILHGIYLGTDLAFIRNTFGGRSS